MHSEVAGGARESKRDRTLAKGNTTNETEAQNKQKEKEEKTRAVWHSFNSHRPFNSIQVAGGAREPSKIVLCKRKAPNEREAQDKEKKATEKRQEQILEKRSTRRRREFAKEHDMRK